MVRDEMLRRLIKHHVLARHDVGLLAKGANHVRAAHALMKVGEDGVPQGRAYLFNLVLSVKPRLAQMNHEREKEQAGESDLPGAETD